MPTGFIKLAPEFDYLRPRFTPFEIRRPRIAATSDAALAGSAGMRTISISRIICSEENAKVVGLQDGLIDQHRASGKPKSVTVGPHHVSALTRKNHTEDRCACA